MPNTFSGWVWWVFVDKFLWVIAGYLIIDYLIKPRVIPFLGKYSERQKAKNEARRREIENRVELILSNPLEREYFYSQLSLQHSRHLYWYTLIFIFFVTGLILGLMTKDVLNNLLISFFTLATMARAFVEENKYSRLRDISLEFKKHIENRVADKLGTGESSQNTG